MYLICLYQKLPPCRHSSLRLVLMLFFCGALSFFILTGQVFGAAAGSIAPAQGSEPNYSLPPKPVQTRKMQHPGLISGGEVRQDTIHLLYPQDGAIIPNKGVITLGWMPPTEEVLPDTPGSTSKAYIIEVAGDNGVSIRAVVPSHGESGEFSSMVAPPAPGKYKWQIFSIMTGGGQTASDSRVFTVLR